MIEILMLYTIRNREKTIYGIRKDIIEIFGMFTEPSIGTIYPALKRLLSENAVNLNERMSEGGKKSSYYSITQKGFEVFKKLFFNSASDNPSLFNTHLQARLGTMSMLTPEERKKFIYDSKRRIDFFLFGLERKLNDEFIELDYYQRKLFEKNMHDLKETAQYIEKLEINISE